MKEIDELKKALEREFIEAFEIDNSRVYGRRYILFHNRRAIRFIFNILNKLENKLKK